MRRVWSSLCCGLAFWPSHRVNLIVHPSSNNCPKKKTIYLNCFVLNYSLKWLSIFSSHQTVYTHCYSWSRSLAFDLGLCSFKVKEINSCVLWFLSKKITISGFTSLKNTLSSRKKKIIKCSKERNQRYNNSDSVYRYLQCMNSLHM